MSSPVIYMTVAWKIKIYIYAIFNDEEEFYASSWIIKTIFE